MLGSLTPIQPKRKVFISYHHANDQFWYDTFSNEFDDQLDLFYDGSLDRRIDSTNAQYLDRTIRENYISGTSITIVLIGTETWKRRWVDWEIYATLEDEHALLGIVLPEPFHTIGNKGGIMVPDRFLDNHSSGYAHIIHWTNDANFLNQAIEYAIAKSKVNKRFLVNSRPKLSRNHS